MSVPHESVVCLFWQLLFFCRVSLRGIVRPSARVLSCFLAESGKKLTVLGLKHLFFVVVVVVVVLILQLKVLNGSCPHKFN